LLRTAERHPGQGEIGFGIGCHDLDPQHFVIHFGHELLGEELISPGRDGMGCGLPLHEHVEGPVRVGLIAPQQLDLIAAIVQADPQLGPDAANESPPQPVVAAAVPHG
jgi:hypothetical protein